MNVGYSGPIFDHSGYGEANRHDIAALESAGAKVIGESVSYVRDSTDLGSLAELMHSVIHRNDDYKVKIIHTTPNVYKNHMERGKYHIGRLFWETDKLPQEFVDGCNMMDEIWTGSEANVQAAKKGGVNVQIHVIPQAIQTERPECEPYQIADFDGFLFYSIFEWIDRKNPQALLEAYWRAFQNKENVGLLIKTYFRDFSFTHKKMISDQIKALKERIDLPYFPPVFVFKELLDRDQMWRLHKSGDCFISVHRGEGWGLPQVEAMLAGNPIISTGYGGCHEYLKDGEDAYLLDYDMSPVSGMRHSAKWYDSSQNWADVSIKDIIEKMRLAYSQKEKSVIGKNGWKTVSEKFSPSAVGKIMLNRLNEISKEL